ncbi:unnamed protein product [Acidithrix sp. C25]|nr:unnamed protein product [Acidithrix sp. C25]
MQVTHWGILDIALTDGQRNVIGRATCKKMWLCCPTAINPRTKLQDGSYL